MKMRITLILTGFAMLSLMSCQSKEQKVENAEENVLEEKQDVADANLELKQARDQYRSEAEVKITENEKSIEDLRARMKDSKNKLDANYNEEVNKLEERNKNMRARLNDYKDDGKDRWEEFKREFNHDMDELGQALKDLGKDNKK